MTVCILKLQVSLVNIHEHAICGHSFTEDLRAAPTHSLGFNQRESKLAERVRDVEEENHILRKQLRLAHYEIGLVYECRVLLSAILKINFCSCSPICSC
jgi:hypothetical protein